MSDFLPQSSIGKIGLALLIITLIIVVVIISRLTVEINKLETNDKESDSNINKSIKDYQEKNDKSIKDYQEKNDNRMNTTNSTMESLINGVKTLLGFNNGRADDNGYLSEWSACSVPCGGGVQIRTYSPAINKGVEHKDKNVLVQYCNAQACPLPPSTTTTPPAPETPSTTTPPETPSTTPAPETPSTTAPSSSFSNYNDWLTNKLYHR